MLSPPCAARVLAVALLLASLSPPGAAQGPEHPAPAPDAPDLAPVRAGPLGGANITAGRQAIFQVEVANLGAQPSGATTVSFALGNVALGNTSLAAIAVNGALNITSPPWQAVAGNHTLTIIVDAGAVVVEADEGNNELQLDFTVAAAPPALPDLVILDVGPAEPAVLGRNVSLQARVLNAGLAPSGAFDVAFEVDGALLGKVAIPALRPGEPALASGMGITVRSTPWLVSGGNHTVRAIVDAADAILEEEERNNALQRTIAPLTARFDGPDLRVADVRLDPDRPRAGFNATFRAIIANTGNEASAPFEVRFTLDNQTLSTQTFRRGLEAGANAEVVSGNWTATVGEHEMLVVAVSSQAGNETAQLNNGLPYRFRILNGSERADLALDLAVPAVATEGEVLRFAAIVRNDGDARTTGTEVRFSIDGHNLSSATIEALEPGQRVRVEAKGWTATLGLHTVAARVDPGKLLPQLDRLNDVMVRDVDVAPAARPNLSVMADLAVAKLAWDPVDPQAGQLVVLRVDVHNEGNLTAGAFLVQFLVDGQLHDQQPVAGLGLVDAKLLSRPWLATPGRHTFGVRLDANGVLGEAEEGNNVAYGAVDVSVGGGIAFARSVPIPWAFGLLALGGAAIAMRRARS